MARIIIQDLPEKMRASREEMNRIQGGFQYYQHFTPSELYGTTYGGDGRTSRISSSSLIIRNMWGNRFKRLVDIGATQINRNSHENRMRLLHFLEIQSQGEH